MTHHDTQPGSLPEDRFDQWLDALVTGTPGDAASLNGTDGSLGRAMSGARQLHGLAAETTPAAAAQRRIEEDLMRSGTLAAPRGTTWIPIEKETKRTPWWSPTSPVIAAALVVALIVALGASLIATQRPAEAPTPAPGFAMASPDATEPTPVSSLPIIEGEPSDELRSRLGSYGVIGDAGLTITRPGEDDIILPEVMSAYANGVPGEAVLTRDDGSRSVVALTTGETRFDLPPAFGKESQAGTYLFIPESDENAGWTIWDLRTGDSRPLSEIVDLPVDQPVVPVSFGMIDQESTTVYVQFVTPEFDTAPTSDIPSFVIAGSLDRATTLDGYPPASQARQSLPVTSPDGTTVAWAAIEPENAIVIADTATGDELARVPVEDFHALPEIGGFTMDEEHLIVLTHASAFLVAWGADEPEVQVIADTSGYALNPRFHTPTNSLYYRQVDSLLRMTVPDGDVETVIDHVSDQYSPYLSAHDARWFVVNLDTGIALIDARTGEVVSHLRNMPPNQAEFGAFSLSSSRDGSTVLQVIGGSDSAWLVSPDYPDGLVLTAPIDPDIIAASDSPDGIPVHYTISPDGGSVVASTSGEGGSIPRFVAEVGPDPEWAPISDGAETLYWLPMPAAEHNENIARPLPAQEFATPAASPVAASAPGPVMVIEGTAAEARVEDGVRIATLGSDGLTLPVDGDTVTLPDVAQIRWIWGHLHTLHVIREDGTEAVIDLATGDVRFELPGFENWARGSGRWQLVPTDDSLTDWTVIDMTTGETRLLSELVELPADTATLPREAPSVDPNAPSVFEVEPVTIDGTRLNPSGPPVATFVVAGSLDRVSTLPDYPTARDNVGSPTLVASADGGTVAYETRAGDSRIAVLDTATGEELGRFDVDVVGENPTLAGFSGDSRDLIVTTDDGRVLQLAPDGRQPMVLHNGLEGIDNPLLFRDGSTLYVRQVDKLLRIEMLPGGVVTEVAAGLVPGAFGFTTPGGNWIVAQTRDGHMLVDARTGEVVSRMKAPANRAQLADGQSWGWFDVDADGDTVLFAIATTPMGPSAPPDASPAAWLLSPEFPDGLEVTAPEDAGNYWLSPDGETLFAWTSERQSGPGTIWRTPLGEEPDWQPVVEDVTPLPAPMMFFPER